jgi:hypothetical protein
MLKYVLFASAMTMAAPAIAQQAQTAPQTAPATGADATGTAATPSQGAQADVTATPQGDPATATTPPAQTAQTPTSDPATQGTNQPDQVAAILDSEFPTYDKDKSGSLNKAEFASWMDTLKAKADPSAKPDKAWNTAAFKKADTDKSSSVSKTELAAFLSSSAKAG